MLQHKEPERLGNKEGSRGRGALISLGERNRIEILDGLGEGWRGRRDQVGRGWS